MRILITSDIHYFPQWKAQIEQLAWQMQSLQPDLLILAGDIGEPLPMYERALRIFKPVCRHRAVIAGNHDVWHRAMSHTSQELWDGLLRDTAQAHGYTWLEENNLIIDHLGICGTLAWYDYGGKHPRLNFDDGYYERIKSRVSNDANYIDWPWTDREFAADLSTRFLKRLDQLEASPKVKEVLAVTHVPLYAGCLKPIFRVEQGIANAYYANIQLGQQVLRRRKVMTVVSGHVHQERSLEIPRQNSGLLNLRRLPPLKVHTIPADYGEPAALMVDTRTWERSVIRPAVLPMAQPAAAAQSA
jgi:3',5'-cyclic AMP phosphodiesterase CpdA